MSKHRTRGGIWNRLLSGLLCLTMLAGLLPGTLLPAGAAEHWAMPYARQLVDWGVMRGDISGNLNLNRPITRAELVTMINRAYGYDKLGTMPFTDVQSSDWYAEDINIAYNMGYFKGTSNTTASPKANVTREQAAVFLARNLVLREKAGESLGFSDSRTMSEWSRGLIAAAVEEGMITGYSDGSFRPFQYITRGEVAAMLVRVIGTLVDKPGNQSLGDVYGNVTISSTNVSLRNTTILGNLYLTGGIGLGNVLLENVTVLGQIVVSGAGESHASDSSVILRNVEADKLVVDSVKNQFVTLRVEGVTDIPETSVRTNAYVDDSSIAGYGLTRIELDGENGVQLQLAGSVKEVVNLTPASDLQLVQGSAEKVTVDEVARGSTVLVGEGTRMDELNLDVATLVTGDGDIKNLNVGSAGCEIDPLPDGIVIRPGISADVDGNTMDSNDAAEMSAEPRLMASFPRVQNISPTGAEAVFSANKPGTIYWAVSAMADGSVGEEDLISNPAYGGNIFEGQAGQINASSARTEYKQAISKLTQDGSYYLSAILVDGRGKRSPVKVIAFSTPDDTQPAFVAPYPQITKATTEVAQTTVMVNKNCLLYWALLPDGAQAPTSQELKTGSISGNSGWGSLSVVKNATISINVNRTKLREKTSYDLFLWLTDHNGAKSSSVVKLDLTTPDETPPIVTMDGQFPPYGDTTASATFSINEAPATLFWAAVAEGNQTFITPGATPEENDEIMADRRTKMRVESGKNAGATASGSVTLRDGQANMDTILQATGLNLPGISNYTLYYVGKDAAGNYSERVGQIRVQTTDKVAPTVKYEFVNGVDGRPKTGEDLKLVFSENVQGGGLSGVDTFEDYYNTVKSSIGTPNEDSARNALAEELSKHFRLYRLTQNASGGTGSYVPVEPYTGPVANKLSETTEWTIDFRYAEINKKPNGEVELIFPASIGDLRKSAIQLESGATYYFQLLSVFDIGIQPNGVAENPTDKNETGNYTMPAFKTIYGQVQLANNSSIIKIDSTDANLNNIRLDMCIELTPESTKKMPTTEYWDMIMWSDDVTVDVLVYRQEVSKDASGNEKTGPWTCLNPNNTPITIKGDPNKPAASLGWDVLGGSVGAYGVVKNTLQEGHTYRYGIHFTSVDLKSEGSDKTKTPDNWDSVTMRFSLIAGSLTNVRVVSAAPNPSATSAGYDGYIERELVSEIGIVYETPVKKILSYTAPFQNTRVPSFQSTYPTFEAESGSIKVNVQLTGPGTVNIVAAEVGTIPVTMDTTGTTINATNDGSATDGMSDADKATELAKLTERTYIPMDGADRNKYAQYISYMASGTKDAVNYASPRNIEIANPEYWYASELAKPDSKIHLPEGGPIKYVSATEDGIIRGLKANTYYYIYVVLQGGGNPGPTVEVYRVKTAEAKPPIVEIRNSRTAADMTTPHDDGTEIYYALAVLNSLPSTLNTKYYWTEGGTAPSTPNPADPAPNYYCTVWEAMMRRDSSNKTLFDRYVDDVDKKNSTNLRNDVYRWISKSGEQIMGQGPLMRYGPFDGPSKSQDFTKDMNSKDAEYVVFVIARNSGAEDSAANYGFAAARGLFYPDTELPEFNSGQEYKGYPGVRLIRFTPTKVYDATGADITNTDWRSDPKVNTFKFDGSLILQFTAPVYQVVTEGGTVVRKEVWSASPDFVEDAMDADSDLKAVSILDIMTPTGYGTWSVAKDVKGAAQSFTLTFEKISNGSEIYLPNSGNLGNSNPDVDASTKHLTVTLDTTLTEKHWSNTPEDFPAGTIPTRNPGFRATWQ